MPMSFTKRLSLGLLAGAMGFIALAAAGQAAAQAQDRSSLVIQHAQSLHLVPNRVRPTLPHQRGQDHVFVLGCAEVGNGDVATRVRLTNMSSGSVVPGGTTVSVYGSAGQWVQNLALGASLWPGQHVDVTVAPWQAVYQGCLATASL